MANRIENNHIHHINHREILSDNGGIYTLGQQPGTVLRGNVIHDISCYGYGAWGIYPDEGSSEMRIEKNLVYGTKKASFSTHYGRDNLVQHNIFALSQADHLCLGKRETHRTTLFRRNVVVAANGRVPGGVWDAAYDTVADNLFWSLDGTPFSFNGQSLAALLSAGQNTGAVIADPLFTDAAGGDFSLRPDSPALRAGFRPFDWRAAGPRLVADRPRTYEDYVRRFPLPAAGVPVVRTRITLVTPAEVVEAGGRAEFTVTLTNIGRAAGKGVVRLASGPKGAAGRPSVKRIAYALQPGEEITERIGMKVRRGTRAFWLDSEPTGSGAVPARGLVLESTTCRWAAPRLAGVVAPEAIGAALARVPARRITHGDRLVAEVKLATGANGLLLFARFHEPNLRPNLAEPWLGTAIELIAFQPVKPGTPVDQPVPKRQAFLVPRAGGVGADGLRLTAPGGERVERAPEIRACAAPMPGGCELAAVMPWTLFGFEQPPAEFPFELIVDAVDPSTGEVVQRLTFDPPWDGWRRLPGYLVPAPPA